MSEPVPVERTVFASTCPDEAWDALSRMYTRARPHSTSEQASIRFDTVATPELSVDRGRLSAAEGAFDPSPDQLNIISVLAGRISLDFGRRGAVANTAGDCYLYLPDSSADLRWADFDALPVRLPLAQVARSVVEQTGLPAHQLRFTSPRPLTAQHAQLWVGTAGLLWSVLTAPEQTQVGPLVHQELVNLAAATAVSVFPNSAMTLGYVAGPGDVRPAAVRRAVAYIDTHASLPITVSDIAQAAGTTPRAIRAAFRRHLDTTPTALLRRARLDGARAELAAASGADPAIGEVATRWGFRDHRRFVADFTAAFGVPPG